jgi:hypothetical protein
VRRRRVLQHHHFLALEAAELKLGDGRGTIGEKTLAIGWIDPRACHDLCAVAWPDAMLVIVGEFANDIRVDEALLHEQGFQRLDSQRRVGRRIGMIVIGHGDVSLFLFVAGRETKYRNRRCGPPSLMENLTRATILQSKILRRMLWDGARSSVGGSVLASDRG